MKKTKWNGYAFNADQKKARAIHKKACQEYQELLTGLKCIHGRERQKLHDRLDSRLDSIERRQKLAIDIFPEVDNSFSMYTMTIS